MSVATEIASRPAGALDRRGAAGQSDDAVWREFGRFTGVSDG
ncbi:MAG: hypothetical protein ABR970_18535 [Roseiarcus sp.]|jgi:hypothetical protein